MSTVVKGLGSGNSVLVKGAPERVIAKCNSYKLGNGEVKNFTSEKEKEILIANITKLASQGLRCLGLSCIYDGGKLADLTEKNMEDKLADTSKYAELEVGGTFLGVVGIKDPVRPEVKGAIEDCKTAGIRVIMITGDSKETAVAIAKELDIIDPKSDPRTNSYTGMEFISLTPEKKRQAL